MLIYEYKLAGTAAQYAAIDEAIRVVQFIRNTCLRKWMDERGISKNDLQCNCAVLAKAYPFATRLTSQARQASADRAWFAVSSFYENCKSHKPGKKGYPKFQHDNRSVEYKQTGWKLEPDGKHICFTDGCGMRRLRLVGNPKQSISAFPLKQIKRVRIVHRADGYSCQFSVRAERSVKHTPTGKQARQKLAKAHVRVQRQREDFARKQASTLVSSSDLIAYEHLQMRNMVKNHHLAKSIHDAGWGTFLRWVNYYGALHEIKVIAVAPQFTSQDCSACGTVVKKSLSVRTHICTGCGVVLDRDHNAALNILAKACTLGHRGTSGSPENASGQMTATCEQQCS